MTVTRSAWMAHNTQSSINCTKYVSAASCSAISAELWNLKSFPLGIMFVAISLINREKGNLGIRRFVLFWYLLISKRALVPGRYRLFLLSRRLVSFKTLLREAPGLTG